MNFIGLLQNVDSSILDVKLENSFEFKSISEREGTELFSKLEKLPRNYISRKLSTEYPCLNLELNQYFVVENSFDIIISNEGFVEGFSKIQKLELFYLLPKISLMLLFKEGNIAMPISYYWYKEPCRLFTGRTSFDYSHSSRLLYTLNHEEIPKLQDFLKSTRMPFRDYIQLAFDNFELSYEIHVGNVAFLSLMNGLEALFNPGGGEITYKLSRNCAVLLGKNKQEATEIFRNVKELYDLRSSIVHGAKRNVEEGKLNNLRGYLRESIKRLIKINKPKEKILDTLNKSAFGEQVWGPI